MSVASVRTSSSLAPGLARLHERLVPFAHEGGAVGELACTAVDRLERDLLPRTAGGAAHLVVGIVGPNNAGKSALFNALAGRLLSPSRPSGGATRRLVGAARADLLGRLVADPALARFPLRTVEPGPDGMVEATESGADAAELLLAVAEDVAEGVLLVDTPDFDSVQTTNRRASEAFLRVADLALVVVTRHTYQNREVVEFLESWLSHGRPWMLVYNESISPAVTVAHAAKLADDVGELPLTTFHAPFDLAVAQGARDLDPRALPDAPAALPVPGDASLASWLSDVSSVGGLKARALAASLAELRGELAALVARLDEEAARAAELSERARSRARRLGERVARESMPIGPFLEAFRAVLDRRPTLLQRGLRSALRRARAGAERVLTKVRGSGRTVARADERLLEVEGVELARAWAPFFEDLARELDPGRAPTRDGEPLEAGLAAALHRDLAPRACDPARERARASLSTDPEVLTAFRAACEERIEAELEVRGSEWFLQLGVDALHLLPAVAAGVVILKTGGLGADVAVGGAGALSTLLAERLSRLLGSHVALAARQRWASLRGERLASSALAAALPEAGPMLEDRVGERSRRARELADAMKEVSWNATRDREV